MKLSVLDSSVPPTYISISFEFKSQLSFNEVERAMNEVEKRACFSFLSCPLKRDEGGNLQVINDTKLPYCIKNYGESCSTFTPLFPDDPNVLFLLSTRSEKRTSLLSIMVNHSLVDMEGYLLFCHEFFIELFSIQSDEQRQLIQSRERVFEATPACESHSSSSLNAPLDCLRYSQPSSLAPWFLWLFKPMLPYLIPPVMRLVMPDTVMIKAKLEITIDPSSSSKTTANDLCCALLWKAVCTIRELKGETKSSLVIAVNSRRSLSLCESNEREFYLGNASLFAGLTRTVDEIDNVQASADGLRQSIIQCRERTSECLAWLNSVPRLDGVSTPFVSAVGGKDVGITNWSALTREMRSFLRRNVESFSSFQPSRLLGSIEAVEGIISLLDIEGADSNHFCAWIGCRKNKINELKDSLNSSDKINATFF